MATARLGHVPGDALAHLVLPQLLFLFVKAVRSFDFQGVAEQQRKRSVQHSHVGVQNREHIIQKFFDIPFVDNDGTDFLNDRSFWTNGLFHNL